MAQHRITIDGTEIWQPDKGLKHSFATTYSEDSTRVQSGVGHFTPLFTVEQESYTASHIPVIEASKILKLIIGRNFTLHYFSPYHADWKDATFYVGQGECQIGTLEDGGEKLSSLSFNMTGVNPI